MSEKLKTFWIQNEIAINGPVSRSEIVDFETQHELVLPDSFKQYLSVVNGMAIDEADGELISFFSLEQIGQNLKSPQNNPLREFLFADYLMGSHGYVIDLKNDSEHILVSDYGGGHKLIAPSFTSFIEMYLNESASVINCW